MWSVYIFINEVLGYDVLCKHQAHQQVISLELGGYCIIKTTKYKAEKERVKSTSCFFGLRRWCCPQRPGVVKPRKSTPQAVREFRGSQKPAVQYKRPGSCRGLQSQLLFPAPWSWKQCWWDSSGNLLWPQHLHVISFVHSSAGGVGSRFGRWHGDIQIGGRARWSRLLLLHVHLRRLSSVFLWGRSLLNKRLTRGRVRRRRRRL